MTSTTCLCLRTVLFLVYLKSTIKNRIMSFYKLLEKNGVMNEFITPFFSNIY